MAASAARRASRRRSRTRHARRRARPRRTRRGRARRGARAPAARPRRDRSAPARTRDTARSPPGRSSAAVPVRSSARIASAWAPMRRARRRRPRAAGGRAARARAASEVDAGGRRSARVDRRVEHLGLVAQHRERAQRRSPPPPGAAQCRQDLARIRPRADVALVASSRHGSPRAHAVRRGLRARHAQQRPDDPARALRHAEQRAPAGRGDQPVEDGLGLVGRGVADGDQRVALGEPLRLGVAHLPRPGLHVALRRARAVHVQRHAEPLAQRAAVRLVGVGLRRAARS